jgi:ABC-type multidrug transport system fused ATPase/permease subunit
MRAFKHPSPKYVANNRSELALSTNNIHSPRAYLPAPTGIPILVMIIALFVGSDDWWSITALVWFSCVFVFYVVFCSAVVAFEMHACLQVMKNQFDDDDDDILSLIRRSILLRQRRSYAGTKTKMYIARGSITDATGEGNRLVEESMEYQTGIYSRMTHWGCLSCIFEPVEERTYTLEDVQGQRPFVTKNNWSLEKIFCRPRDARYVVVIDGPSKLTRSQMRSSLICAFIGYALIILVIASFLVWADLGGTFVLIVCILVLLVCFTSIRSSWRIARMTRDVMQIRMELSFKKKDKAIKKEPQDPDVEAIEEIVEDTATDDANVNAELESEGMFFVWENYRITRPSKCFCWIMFAIEILLLFLCPFIGLMVDQNWPIAVLFFVIAFFSGIRFYFNAAIALEEVGSLDYIKGETEAIRWKNRARINDIVGNITRGRSMGAWTVVLCVFLLAFLALLFGATVTSSTSTSSDVQYQFLPGFYYEQQDDLPYPTCEFGKGLEDSPSRALADYAFLSSLAYRSTNITQEELDGWFGEGVATNHPEVVAAFQQTWTDGSGATYKLITFDVNGKTDGLVAIRGTTNPWDMLTGT